MADLIDEVDETVFEESDEFAKTVSFRPSNSTLNILKMS